MKLSNIWEAQRSSPISFVKHNDLVTTRRQRNFLLGEAFDPVSNDVDAYMLSETASPHPARRERTSLIASIELQHSLFVCISKQLPRQTHNRRRLSDTRHA